MKATEAAMLLTICAAYDNRKPDADQAKAWSMVLDGFRFEDCREAIVTHYRTSREWIMPADVIAGVKRLRRDRVLEFGTLPDPPREIDPDDTEAMQRWHRTTLTAIADGTYRRPEPEALTARRDVIAELGHVGRSIDSAEAVKPLRAIQAEVQYARQEAEAEKKRAVDEKRAKREAAEAAERARREATPTPPTRAHDTARAEEER